MLSFLHSKNSQVIIELFLWYYFLLWFKFYLLQCFHNLFAVYPELKQWLFQSRRMINLATYSCSYSLFLIWDLQMLQYFLFYLALMIAPEFRSYHLLLNSSMLQPLQRTDHVGYWMLEVSNCGCFRCISSVSRKILSWSLTITRNAWWGFILSIRSNKACLLIFVHWSIIFLNSCVRIYNEFWTLRSDSYVMHSSTWNVQLVVESGMQVPNLSVLDEVWL